MSVTPREKFKAVAARLNHDNAALVEAALWVAAEEYPELDVEGQLARFDWLAERVRRLGAKLKLPRAEALRVALAEEQGFHGNRENYADPCNSFLNDVLDRRTGIPITLSMIYIETARRLGWEAYGVNFPGHFLMAVIEIDAQRKIVDPFNGGKILTQDDCAHLAGRMSGGKLPFSEQLLEPAPPSRIVYRLLSNLKRIYTSAPVDPQKALAIVERLLVLAPDSDGDLRDRERLRSLLPDQVQTLDQA